MSKQLSGYENISPDKLLPIFPVKCVVETLNLALGMILF